MKKLLVLWVVAGTMTGCALIFPRDHDPVMFGYLVDTKIAVGKLSCDDKATWSTAEITIEKLKVYTDLRKDPQADAVAKLEDAVKKAKESGNKTFCESVLKINKTRIDVIVDAWKGR